MAAKSVRKFFEKVSFHQFPVILLLIVVNCLRFIAAASINCKNAGAIDIREHHGVRTENFTASRIEYDPFPVNFTMTHGGSIFVEFKSNESSGLIFLTGNFDKGHMVAVYLTGNSLTFERHCGHGRISEIHTSQVNDGNWHTLKYVHSSKVGKLHVDGVNSFRQFHIGPCSDFSSLFLGGLSSELKVKYNNMMHHLPDRFSGCLRKMKIDDKMPAIHPKYFVVSQC